MGFTNKELLELIGEIDGITLESVGNGVAVFLDIGGRQFELIRDFGEGISHHLTRCGINEALSDRVVSINNQPSPGQEVPIQLYSTIFSGSKK